MIYKIAITTGDTNGIGLEVACKALSSIRLYKNIEFILFFQNTAQLKFINKFKKKFKNRVHLLRNSKSPAIWVEDVLYQILSKEISGLVTGPLSKPAIIRAGLKDIGHTDIIKRVTRSKLLNMCFIGKKFNVGLVTSHIPLASVAKSLSTNKIILTCREINHFLKINFPKKSKLPIGILGLNPHAGDNGILGKEEDMVIKAIELLKKEGINAVGPLVPDSTFISKNLKKYSFFVALYHDQGLIPFKLAHEYSGVHLTLGSQIIRTSVDHGTAFDIFNENIADPRSMIDAINLCVKLVRSKYV